MKYIQLNSSNLDTVWSEESVPFREVSLFQGLKSTQTWNLGRKKVSCLERCLYFRGVLIEGFHCTYMYILYKGVYILYQRFHCILKSIRVHLSPGSSCGLVVYTLRILAQRYTFFMGHTAIF